MNNTQYLRPTNVEIGTFAGSRIVHDWREWDVEFSKAEDGSIVICRGWDCEIWLRPDGTYYASIAPKLFEPPRKRRLGPPPRKLPQIGDGCIHHPECLSCPYHDCVAGDNELLWRPPAAEVSHDGQKEERG